MSSDPADFTAQRMLRLLRSQVDTFSLQLRGHQLTLGTALDGDLAIDSIDWANLACAIEEEFGCTVSDCAMANAATVADLLALVSAPVMETADVL